MANKDSRGHLRSLRTLFHFFLIFSSRSSDPAHSQGTGTQVPGNGLLPEKSHRPLEKGEPSAVLCVLFSKEGTHEQRLSASGCVSAV
jgi:hypothetical protein